MIITCACLVGGPPKRRLRSHGRGTSNARCRQWMGWSPEHLRWPSGFTSFSTTFGWFGFGWQRWSKIIPESFAHRPVSARTITALAEARLLALSATMMRTQANRTDATAAPLEGAVIHNQRTPEQVNHQRPLGDRIGPPASGTRPSRSGSASPPPLANPNLKDRKTNDRTHMRAIDTVVGRSFG